MSTRSLPNGLPAESADPHPNWLSGKIAFSGVFICVYAIAIFPILNTRILPLFDYPAHLARMHVISHLNDSATLQQFFTLHWTPVPNLAMDLIVPALATVMPLEIAGKGFVALALLLLAIGTVALHYVIHRRLSAYPLLVFLFLYNVSFLFGFLNYIFSLGAFLIMFALWLSSSSWRWPTRLCVFSIFSSAIFFMHLYGFGLYGVSVLAYEIPRVFAQRRTDETCRWQNCLVTLGQFAIPVLIFVTMRTTSGQTTYADLTDQSFYWAKPFLFFDLIYNYNRPLDLLTGGFLIAGIMWGIAARRLTVDRRMCWPLAGLLVAFVLMPKIVAGGWAVDERMPIAISLVFIGSSNWSFRSRLLDKLSAATIACLFVVRMTTIAITWAQYDRLYEEYREAIDMLPYGTRLTAAIAYPEGFPRLLRPSLMHLGNFITVDRDGFYQTFFANSGQQPVSLTPLYRSLQDRYLDPLFFRRDQLNSTYLLSVRNPFDKDLLAQYDAILVVREREFGLPLPDNLEPIYVGDDFRLFKIIRTSKQNSRKRHD